MNEKEIFNELEEFMNEALEFKKRFDEKLNSYRENQIKSQEVKTWQKKNKKKAE